MAALAAAAERGSIPFSTTASSTDNITIIILTTFLMSSDISGLSKIGLTLLARAVAVTRSSLIVAESKVGLRGGVVGEIIPTQVVSGVDFLLGFRTLRL